MTIYRWKIMACSLGLSLVGLAMCCGQQNDNKVAPPVVPPVIPGVPIVPPSNEKPPVLADTPPLPNTILPPVSVPQAPPPTDPIVAPTPPAEKIPAPVAQSTNPIREKPPAPKLAEQKPVELAPPADAAAPVKTYDPLIAPPVLPAAASVKSPDVKPPVGAPVQSSTPPLSSQASATAPTSKLKMLVRLGDGKPRFEIRYTGAEEVLLKVYGEKIEMQSPPEGVKSSPIAGVTAIGKVRFTGAGIEGTCDNLSVLSGTGEVLLKGNVHLKTKRGKSWSEMTTEKMIYQIGASSVTTPVIKGTPGEHEGY